MEKSVDLETKYQKLATEYSKMRSHATVLKKAVLDEQSKILELREIIKEQEQKNRKHDQEMDSLTFRNDQLTKRISVLQQELQNSGQGKKGKNKATDSPVQSNFNVLEVELHKKILENAQLHSAMDDKDLEISSNKEKIQWLEERVDKLQNDIIEIKNVHKIQLEQSKENSMKNSINKSTSFCDKCKKNDELQKELSYYKQESERWSSECNMLRSKPTSNENLTEYYESQLTKIYDEKQTAVAETSILWAENDALSTRLEHITLEKNALERILDKSTEELHTTHQNYKSQLDAMTEHMAAQNEKITKQCDQIEMLQHKLTSKK
ncbi:protein phosphatase 1 regulatory subunit 21 [Onthophagus taurus]|uniref:protein phosphatase 1 regulatory subunit 21 n=1 Tax=Onthophagus taurus TaxID=166361 RepID=UPI000C20716C|nr:protein phosphatase 1 regulatory subunit 21 [Onthophagus taurus]